MAQEVERKFLLSGDGWRRHVTSSRSLAQFYLFSLPGRILRVRIANSDQAWLTMKFGGPALARDEFEYEIPLADALAMRPLASGNVIEKTRHLVPFGDHTFEVDVFAGALSGLMLCEVELGRADETLVLPGWVGREVTGRPEYYNAHLALHGSQAAVA